MRASSVQRARHLGARVAGDHGPSVVVGRRAPTCDHPRARASPVLPVPAARRRLGAPPRRARGRGLRRARAARPSARPRSDAAATVVAEHRVAPRVVDLTVRSRALARTAKVRLVTPRGWWARRAAALAGAVAAARLLRHLRAAGRARPTSPRLRALRDVLVVLPEGGAVGLLLRLAQRRTGRRRRRGRRSTCASCAACSSATSAPGGDGRSPGSRWAGSAPWPTRRRHPALPRGRLLLRPGPPAAVRRVPARAHGRLHARRRAPSGATRRATARRGPRTTRPRSPPRLRGTPALRRLRRRAAGPVRPLRAPPDGIEAMVGPRRGVRRAGCARCRPARTDLYGPGTHTWPYWRRELHRALPTLLGALR